MSAIPPPVEPQPAPYSLDQAPAVGYSVAQPPAVPAPPSGAGPHAGVRYGIGVTAAALGGYSLLSGAAFSQLTMAFLPGRGDLAFGLVAVGVLAFWTIVTAAGMVVVPGNPVAGWGAATLVTAGVVVYSIIQVTRYTGALRIFSGSSWFVVLHPATFTLLVVGAAWLIARGRSPLSWLLLLAAFVPGAIGYGATMQGIDPSTAQLLTTPIAAIIGVGTAWLAALMSRCRDALRPSQLG